MRQKRKHPTCKLQKVTYSIDWMESMLHEWSSFNTIPRGSVPEVESITDPQKPLFYAVASTLNARPQEAYAFARSGFHTQIWNVDRRPLQKKAFVMKHRLAYDHKSGCHCRSPDACLASCRKNHKKNFFLVWSGQLTNKKESRKKFFSIQVIEFYHHYNRFFYIQ